MLVFPTATPWGDVIAGCAEAATSERIVFAELPAVQSLARVPELLDELDDADVAGARLLRHDGVTLESAGGGFSSLRYAFALESGTIATTLLPERRQVLWVDRRAFAARRDALLATGPPHWSAGDTLAEADWGWRLSLTGHRVIGSPILIPIDEGVGPARQASALDEEGRRVRAGIALLATMLGESALHRALVQNPAAAETLNPGMSGIVRRRGESDTGRKRPQAEADARESLALSARLGTAVRFAEPELAERRAAVQTARTRTDAALAKALGTAFDIDRPSAVARIVGPAPGRRATARRDSLLRRRRRRHRRPGDPRPRERTRAEGEVRRADRRARRHGLDRRALPGAAPVDERGARPPGRLRRDRAAGPRERVVPGDPGVGRPDRRRPVRPDEPRVAREPACGSARPVHDEAAARPGRARRLLLLRQRAPARLLDRNAGRRGARDQRRLPRRPGSQAARGRGAVRDPGRAPGAHRAGRPRGRRRNRRRRSALPLERRALGLVRAGALHPRDRRGAGQGAERPRVLHGRARSTRRRCSRPRPAAPSHSPSSSGCATRTSSSTTGRRTRRARTSISTPRQPSASTARTSRRASRSAPASSTASGPPCRSSAARATSSPTSCATRSSASRCRRGRSRPPPTRSCASRATTRCAGLRETISRRSRTGTPGAPRSTRS